MQLQVGPLSARQLRVVLANDLAIDADLHATSLVLERSSDGEIRFHSPALAAHGVFVRRHTNILRAASVQATGASARLDGTQLSAAAISIEDVVFETTQATVRIDRLTLPRGATFASGQLAIPAIEIGIATIEVPALRALAGGGDRAGSGGFRATALAPVLDRIDGQLHVDLDLALTLPVIGRRAATHEFRIEIAGGTVDFGAVEHDLAALEDAVIDVVVDGDRLVIQKDVPLIPFDTTRLLSWPLDDAARELAVTGRVALSTLLHGELPEPDPADADKPSRVALLGLAARNAQIRLDVAAGAAIAIGGGTATLGSVRQLVVAGSIAHTPGEPPPANEVAIAWQELGAALAGVAIGAARIAVGELSFGAMSGQARFAGLVPDRLSATIERIAARDVLVTGLALSAQ